MERGNEPGDKAIACSISLLKLCQFTECFNINFRACCYGHGDHLILEYVQCNVNQKCITTSRTYLNIRSLCTRLSRDSLIRETFQYASNDTLEAEEGQSDCITVQYV